MSARAGEDMAMSSQVSASASPGQAGAAPARSARAVADAFERRRAPAEDLTDHAADIAAAAYAMAGRFHAGGKLVTFGTGAASTDAQHIAVEFVHPVIVGKRALPAVCLTSDIATVTAIAAASGLAEVFAYQVRKLAGPDDIALGVAPHGSCPSVLSGLRTAREAGLLTIALTSGNEEAGAGLTEFADHLLVARSADPCIIKEIHVTIYHLLWELVHVFIEQPSALRGGTVRT